MARSDDLTEELTAAHPTLELTLPVVTTDTSGPSEPGEPVRYEVGEVLGRGGVGEVVRARDVLLQRDVALKSLLDEQPATVARFWHEARVTATLDHPAIMPVYDAGALDGEGPFFAMKMVRGTDLFRAVRHGSAGSVRRRVERLVRVCEAVSYAHSRGWLHRDLKPDNILLGPFGEVLVADWGLAWSLEEERVGPRAGTPCYMAPEQARGEPHDVRADVYALGGTLWFALTGRLPFDGADVGYILAELQQGRGFVPPRDVVDRELHAVVVKALQSDPRRRYQTVEALRSDLEAWLDGEEVGAAHYGMMQRLGRWAGRHRQRLVVGSGLAVVLGMGLAGVGAATALVVAQSARVAWQAAEEEAVAARRAAEAEEARRQQLVAALLANAASHRASGRPNQARAALARAEAAGGGPGLDVARADVLGRASQPIHVLQAPAQVTAVALEPGLLRIGTSDGRWQVVSLPSGEVVREGSHGAEVVTWLTGGHALVRHDEGLRRVDDHGRVVGTWEVDLDGVDVKAWEVGERLVVQRFRRPMTSFAPDVLMAADLRPMATPSWLARRLVMDAFDGGWLLVGDVLVPDRTQRGEVISATTGRSLAATPSRRVVVSGGRVVAGKGGRVEPVSDGASGDAWTLQDRGFRGVPVDDETVVMLSEDGGGVWFSVVDGAVRARLEGWRGRPRDVVASQGWLAVAGAREVAVWGLPDTPLGHLGSRLSHEVVGNDGRLAAVRFDSTVEVIDLPTGQVLWSRETLESPGLQWSGDRRHLLLLEAGGLTRIDLEDETMARTEGVRVFGVGSEVVALRRGFVEWLDDDLTVSARAPLPVGGSWWKGFRAGEQVVFPVNVPEGGRVGIAVGPPGQVEVIAGRDDEVFGFEGARLADGRLVFGRQDGRIDVWDDGTLAQWSLGGAAVFAMAPLDDGLAVADFDGRLYVVDARGEVVYATSFGGYLRDVEVTRDHLLVAGTEGLFSLARRPPQRGDLHERLLAAHAFRHVDVDALADPDDRLTAAIGKGTGVLSALGDRDDPEARILRAWVEREGLD
jgi:outer membrane protein assembly factor BamB